MGFHEPPTIDRLPSSCGRLCMAVLFAVVLSIVAYKPNLGQYFTGTDTLTLIETSRLQTAEDLKKIFFEPLMSTSSFVERAKFYRPIAALSYSLDYFLWRLNPFGYHLTNVILHVGVVVLVVLLTSVLTKGDVGVAWASGIIFSVHPILAESVPAPDLRHDILATLFVVLSLILFLKSRAEVSFRKKYVISSVLTFWLALGSKEIVAFLPCLTFVYAFIFSENASWQTRIAAAAKESSAYVAVTLAYVLWRISVLGGMGGYDGNNLFVIDEAVPAVVSILMSYFEDLLYPHDFMQIFGVVPRSTFIAGLVFVTMLCISRLFGRRGAQRDGRAIPNRKLGIFLAIWLSLPLFIFLGTLTFSHRNMYGSVVPFSMLLGCAFVTGFRHLKSLLSGPSKSTSVTQVRDLICARFQGFYAFIFTGALALSLFAYSPLNHRYGEWEDSSRLFRMLFAKLASVMPSTPVGATIHFHSLPAGFTSYEEEIPRAKHVGYLNDYSIQSWLNLHYPGNRFKVLVHSRRSPVELPRDLNLIFEVADAQNTQVFFNFSPFKVKAAIGTAERNAGVSTKLRSAVGIRFREFWQSVMDAQRFLETKLFSDFSSSQDATNTNGKYSAQTTRLSKVDGSPSPRQ